MEDLYIFALLLNEEIIPEESYFKRLDELFLGNPKNEILLNLEWETNISEAMLYIKSQIDGKIFNDELFGTILMEKIKMYYENNPNIKIFADKMYLLWKSLPETLQRKEPFFALCYADDPLSWGDEEQTRELYEHMMNYYKN